MAKDYLDRKVLEEKYKLFMVEAPNEIGFKIYHLARNSKSDKKVYFEIKRSIRRNGKKEYYCYRYCENGKTHKIYEHRFVYAYLVGPIPAGMEVDHIDNNSLNNDPNNLQLLTPAENRHKIHTDRMKLHREDK